MPSSSLSSCTPWGDSLGQMVGVFTLEASLWLGQLLLIPTQDKVESSGKRLRNASLRLFCRPACEAFSWLMIDMGGVSPLWVGTIHRQLVLGCIKYKWYKPWGASQ